MLKELIEKQIFLVNLENMDIADVLCELEDLDDDYNEQLEDSGYLKDLLATERLDLNKIDGSFAEIKYKNKTLKIKFEENGTEYKLSMLEFLGYPKYKKITSYFMSPAIVVIRNPSEQIGGIIDKNYGFKFNLEL